MDEKLNKDFCNNPRKIGSNMTPKYQKPFLQLKKQELFTKRFGFEKNFPDAIISIPEVVKSKSKTRI